MPAARPRSRRYARVARSCHRSSCLGSRASSRPPITRPSDAGGLFYRMKHGGGQAIEVSAQECIAAMLELSFVFYSYAGVQTLRLGGQMLGSMEHLRLRGRQDSRSSEKNVRSVRPVPQSSIWESVYDLLLQVVLRFHDQPKESAGYVRRFVSRPNRDCRCGLISPASGTSRIAYNLFNDEAV
jgi:hypothetical protein